MFSKKRKFFITALVALIALTSSATTLQAQNRSGSQSLPTNRYYNGFRDYYQGDYTRALRTFNSGSRGAYKDAFGLFMDSICYYTMMGECYYQMGAYAEAVQQYEAAIALYTKFKAWPARTTFPTQIQNDSTALAQAKISWGEPTRKTNIGRFPNQMSMLLGDPQAAERARQQGGVVAQANYRQVDVVEVMRCTALAIHRRHVIKGPTCKHDPFTKDMLSHLSVRSAAGTMSGSWQGVLFGLAQSSIGQYDRAAVTLQQSLQAGGFDHPLTPIALLELGYLSRAKGVAAASQQLFLEASYSAAIFKQYDIVGDAMHAATVVQMINDRSAVFANLEPAAGWANSENAEFLFASLTGDAIWSAAETGASLEAKKLIARNAKILRRGDIADSRVGTQWLYCSALANSMEGETKNANRDLGRFLVAAQRSSLWLYQIGLADELVIKNRVTERAADILYTEMLRDPTTQDWVAQPMDTIAYLITPHIDPMIRWHNINVSLRADLKALEISDLIRRHRFYSALPLGGRQLALRWVTSAPPEALSDSTRQQQVELLAKFPKLKEFKDQSALIVEQLRQLPVSPEKSSDEARSQKQLLETLYNIEATRELFLQSIALRREPCDMAFPPKLSVQQVQDRLPEKQLVIAVFYDGGQYFVNLISKNSYSQEAAIQASVIDKDLTTLLKQLGLGSSGGTISVEDVQSEKWRDTARKISATLFPRTRPDLLESYDEVIIVPDGPLWYFPFELVQIGTADESVNLYDKVNVRYAPTISTTIVDKRQRRRFGKTLVVAGRTNARDDQKLAGNAFTELQTHISNAELIDKSNKTPSNLISAFVEQVIVWDEIDSSKEPSMLLSPMSYDAGRNGSSIGNWLGLPWTNVDQIVMPGFKSAIGGNKLSKARGDEMFLTSCAMLATGTKSMLISRWPVGGQTTLDLTKEFAKESQHSSPIVALRRSIELLRESEIDLDIEPRVRAKKIDEPLKADHPLFWSSYMLFDLAAPDPVEPPVDPDVDPEKDGSVEPPKDKAAQKDGDDPMDDKQKDDAPKQEGKDKKEGNGGEENSKQEKNDGKEDDS